MSEDAEQGRSSAGRRKTMGLAQVVKSHLDNVNLGLPSDLQAQREDYMASSDTRDTLASGNYLGIMNVLMSLRKVFLLTFTAFLLPGMSAMQCKTLRCAQPRPSAKKLSHSDTSLKT